MRTAVSLLFAALLSAAAAEKENFTAHTELSYANTAGNTESQDLAGKLKLKYPFSQNTVRFEGNLLYSTNKNFDTNQTSETKSRWDGELNYDYNFNKALAFNYIAGAKGDKFSTFAYQVYTGPGAIWTASKNEDHDLKFQGNILWAWDKYRLPYEAGSDETLHSYAGYQASMEYLLKITKTSKFTQYLMYRSEFEDADNYFAKSRTALESKINSIFSMGMSYTVDYTNQRADSVRSYTDRVFLASIIADF